MPLPKESYTIPTPLLKELLAYLQNRVTIYRGTKTTQLLERLRHTITSQNPKKGDSQ